MAIRTAGMRARVARLLPDTCTIERKVTVSDDGGGTTTTWADHATVSCMIEPAGGGGETGVAGGRISDETTHVVYMAAGTDVTEADRLVVAGQRYDVTAVRRWGSAEVYRTVECRETP